MCEGSSEKVGPATVGKADLPADHEPIRAASKQLEIQYKLKLSREDVSECASLQEDLMNRECFSGPVRWVLKRAEEHVVYSLRDDSVYQVLRPMLRLTDQMMPLPQTNTPDWAQLAAVAAAEAGLLNTRKARSIRTEGGVSRKVLVAYAAAQYFEGGRIS